MDELHETIQRLSALEASEYLDVINAVVYLLDSIESQRFSGASYTRYFKINGTKLKVTYEPIK